MDWLFNREFNTKCVVLSGVAVTAYAILPPRKLWVGAGLAVATYVALGWYDTMYDCNDKLTARGGLFGEITGPFKPPVVAGVYGGSMAEPCGSC